MTQSVLIVVGQASGGVAQQVALQASALTARGKAVEVWGPRTTLDNLGDVGAVTRELAIGDRPHPRDVATIRRLRRELSRFDVVHAQGARAGALVSLAATFLGAQRPRLITTLHNRPIGSRAVTSIGWSLVWLIAQRSDAILGVSPDLVRRVKIFAAGRTALALLRHRPGPIIRLAVVAAPGTVADLPASVGEARRRAGATRFVLGWPADQLTIVTVARLAPQKGLDTVIEAARDLKAGAFKGRSWRWLILGDGPLREDLEAAAQSADVADHLEFLGRREDAVSWLQNADIVVSPALWEGQSVAIMEALSVGAALVATDVGGTRGLTGRAARLVPAANPAALADQIAAVDSSTMLTDQLRAAALSRARTLPRVRELVRQLAAAYDFPI